MQGCSPKHGSHLQPPGGGEVGSRGSFYEEQAGGSPALGAGQDRRLFEKEQTKSNISLLVQPSGMCLAAWSCGTRRNRSFPISAQHKMPSMPDSSPPGPPNPPGSTSATRCWLLVAGAVGFALPQPRPVPSAEAPPAQTPQGEAGRTAPYLHRSRGGAGRSAL